MICELQDKYTILAKRRTRLNRIVPWVVPIAIGLIAGKLISTWYWSILTAIIIAAIMTPIVLMIIGAYYHRRLMSITKQISEEIAAAEPQYIKDTCMDSVVND